MKEKLKIHPCDNVAVCLKAQGEIPAGHKMALCDIPQGGEVIKYGCRIGLARCNIHKGEWVHTHNLRSALRVHEEYVYHPAECALPGRAPRTFRGFVRTAGRVGIRNEIWILPTVGCVGKAAQSLARQTREYLHGSVTDVLAFEHPYGCSQLGDDQENTRQALAALACHPNAGGVLVLGLGCENSGVEEIRKRMENCDPQRVKFLVCQDADDEMAEGLALLHELIDRAAKDVRQEVGEDKLVLGLKCGGSDGFSGLTANPVIGALSDRIVACGGASLLTEVPEMFGAETILMDRCKDEATFRKAVDLINNFKEYFIRHGQEVYENPSPGNKAGGITTLEDKSLGCTQKGGTAEVRDVLRYCEPVTEKGLNLVQGPGNDLCAITALMAAGAQMVLFTTGRGTPVGAPIPTVKVSTNTPLAEKKRDWIDFNAGILAQGADMQETTEVFFKKLLAIASGERTQSETHDYREIAIFKDGVTL